MRPVRLALATLPLLLAARRLGLKRTTFLEKLKKVENRARARAGGEEAEAEE